MTNERRKEYPQMMSSIRDLLTSVALLEVTMKNQYENFSERLSRHRDEFRGDIKELKLVVLGNSSSNGLKQVVNNNSEAVKYLKEIYKNQSTRGWDIILKGIDFVFKIIITVFVIKVSSGGS